MCLSKVWHSKPKKTSGRGWKRFYSFSGHLLGEIFKNRRPVGIWLDAEKFKDPCNNLLLCLRAGDNRRYPVGWHIYTEMDDFTKESERAYRNGSPVDRRVLYKGILAGGWQGSNRVVVARWIKILPIRRKRSNK